MVNIGWHTHNEKSTIKTPWVILIIWMHIVYQATRYNIIKGPRIKCMISSSNQTIGLLCKTSHVTSKGTILLPKSYLFSCNGHSIISDICIPSRNSYCMSISNAFPLILGSELGLSKFKFLVAFNSYITHNWK